MQVLAMTASEQDTIHKILSSVLHLGNVYFVKVQSAHNEGAALSSKAEVKWVSHLLDLSEAWLEEAITMKVTVSCNA